MLKQVVQLKKMISSYFEYYKLNYRIKMRKLEMLIIKI